MDTTPASSLPTHPAGPNVELAETIA